MDKFSWLAAVRKGIEEARDKDKKAKVRAAAAREAAEAAAAAKAAAAVPPKPETPGRQPPQGTGNGNENEDKPDVQAKVPDKPVPLNQADHPMLGQELLDEGTRFRRSGISTQSK